MQEDLRLLQALGTATVSDALDRLGLAGSALGIAPICDGLALSGPAYTVRYAPCGYPKGTVGDYLDDVEPGAVVVLDNGGRVDCTVWGDILTEFGAARGIAGTAVWGVCRDVATALRMGYPLFSHGRFMRTGKDRVEVTAVQVPVSLGDVQVRPADVVIGDDDGVVVVAAGRVAEVCDLAAMIARTEDAITQAVLAGTSLRAARAEFGYHLLQRTVDQP